MQYKSLRQKQWANSKEGIEALGREKVEAMNKESPMNLPERSHPKSVKKKLKTSEKNMNFKPVKSIRWV